MAAAGFTKGADGFWGKDGKALEFKVRVPAFIQPIQAPLTQQLKDAGFNAIQAPIDDTWLPDMFNGKFDTMVFVHCGSLSEPLETLKDFHSKYARREGKPIPYSSRRRATRIPSSTRSSTGWKDRPSPIRSRPT